MKQQHRSLLVLGGIAATLYALQRRAPGVSSTSNHAMPATFGIRDSTPGLGSGWGGIGRTEVFPITGTSENEVEAVVYEMLRDALTDPRVESLAESILSQHNLSFSPTPEAALALHSYVNDRVPNIPDPERFESITDPGTLAEALMTGGPLPYSDCEDKSLLLSSMVRSVGIDATVVFLDIDGDGQIDHAMSLIDVPGQGMTFAETTQPGKPLGWRPEYAKAEAIAFTG